MATQARTAAHDVDPLFIERWSPRAFDGGAMPQADLDILFEAARWAPSAFNYQPWRFLYAHRDTPDWTRFLNLLLPFNQAWVERASVLIYILSDSQSESPTGELKPSYSHSFDAGAAWAFLALQATRLGYHSHAMTGVDFEKARAELKAPDRFRIEAAVAVGRIGDKGSLPESLRAREEPSGRHAIAHRVAAGNFAG